MRSERSYLHSELGGDGAAETKENHKTGGIQLSVLVTETVLGEASNGGPDLKGARKEEREEGVKKEERQTQSKRHREGKAWRMGRGWEHQEMGAEGIL